MMGVLVQGMDWHCCTAQGASVCKSWYEIEVLRKALPTSNRDCWEWEMEVSSRLSRADVEVIQVRLYLGRRDAEGRSA